MGMESLGGACLIRQLIPFIHTNTCLALSYEKLFIYLLLNVALL